MAKYFITFSIFIVFLTIKLSGQLPPIQLDRPDQTECPFIVPTKYVQIESGVAYENVSKGIRHFTSPSTLFKYGLNDKFEFRLITAFITEKTDTKTICGLHPITLGFKTNICQEKGIIPTVSFIGHITSSNIGTSSFHTKFIAPSFRFTIQHTLSSKSSLAYNLGAEWDGETANQTYIYTLTIGMSLTNKLGGYFEMYGFAPKNAVNDHRLDGGFTYLINYNCMIDLSGGLGITKNAPRNYVAAGFSYRFKTINTK